HYVAVAFLGRGARPPIRMGVGHASHVGTVGSVGHWDDGDDAGVLGRGDSRPRVGDSVDGEPRHAITPNRRCAGYPSAALREGRYQQGGIRGEETGPLVIAPPSGGLHERPGPARVAVPWSGR